MTTFLLIGAGAFLGANLRYLVGGWVADQLGSAFPYGTLLINVSGSLLIGLLLTAIGDRFVTPPGLRLFFAVGFLGGYTTFSTFSYESLALIQTRAYLAAALYALSSVVLGLFAVAAGVVLGRLL